MGQGYGARALLLGDRRGNAGGRDPRPALRVERGGGVARPILRLLHRRGIAGAGEQPGGQPERRRHFLPALSGRRAGLPRCGQLSRGGERACRGDVSARLRHERGGDRAVRAERVRRVSLQAGGRRRVCPAGGRRTVGGGGGLHRPEGGVPPELCLLRRFGVRLPVYGRKGGSIDSCGDEF